MILKPIVAQQAHGKEEGEAKTPAGGVKEQQGLPLLVQPHRLVRAPGQLERDVHTAPGVGYGTVSLGGEGARQVSDMDCGTKIMHKPVPEILL